MASQTFAQPARRVVGGDLAYGQRIVADDRFPRNRDVSLRRPCLLITQGEADEKPVESLSAAVEPGDDVIRSKLFDPQRISHWTAPPSNTPGSWNNRANRGRSRAGASRAARNAFHRSLSRPNRVRSASVSSARTSASRGRTRLRNAAMHSQQPGAFAWPRARAEGRAWRFVRIVVA